MLRQICYTKWHLLQTTMRKQSMKSSAGWQSIQYTVVWQLCHGVVSVKALTTVYYEYSGLFPADFADQRRLKSMPPRH